MAVAHMDFVRNMELVVVAEMEAVEWVPELVEVVVEEVAAVRAVDLTAAPAKHLLSGDYRSGGYHPWHRYRRIVVDLDYLTY